MSSSFIILLVISTLGKTNPWPNSLPREHLANDIAHHLFIDNNATKSSSKDFGNIIRIKPAAVLYPSSINDIINLIKSSFNSPKPFLVLARGRGHSARGQAVAENGVVVEMSALKTIGFENKIRVWGDLELGFYVDVSGGDLWIDILTATIEHGLAPMSWTDYLYLSVGGTLSNGGISGQSFKHGPQISNVLEMDVITGKGDLVTCSSHIHSELFYAVLGGLGQFGIITRARIALDKAPKRVKWLRMLYNDFSSFTRDQETLISIHGLDYVEGSLIMSHNSPNNGKSSFFSPSDHLKINSLVTKYGIIYCLEVVKYYNDLLVDLVDKELEHLLKGLSYLSDFIFEKDTSFVGFLNRVQSGEIELESKRLWNVPRPWLNLFVPKSRIMDFNRGVFVNILHKRNITTGHVLVYPINRNKSDDKMSMVTPEEDIFYVIGLLFFSDKRHLKILEDQNKDILRFCNEAEIKVKQYLPHYTEKVDWMYHFGSKWETFEKRKLHYDPKMILSSGQRIFTISETRVSF